MTKLLIIADDFTGAMDTGVQFTTCGIQTTVVSARTHAFDATDADVLVLDAQTRHLQPDEAYRVVYNTVIRAQQAGIRYIYKKTDSALRGNIGSELAAAWRAFGRIRLSFIPAFPKLNRVTQNGVHYINGIPVAESIFGRDPFEPVCCSHISELISQQSDVPIELIKAGDRPTGSGIAVYDAQSDDDLMRIGNSMSPEDLTLCAGCAGFASVLANRLKLKGSVQRVFKPDSKLFVICGSMNPVTIRQIAEAEAAGFPHVQMNAAQKLDPLWSETDFCTEEVRRWIIQTDESGRFILDVNSSDVAACPRGNDFREFISANLAAIARRLLDEGLHATLLCTGGDTLQAFLKAVNVHSLTPLGELMTGVVLSQFNYRGRDYYIIVKSGGIGDADTFIQLHKMIES